MTTHSLSPVYPDRVRSADTVTQLVIRRMVARLTGRPVEAANLGTSVADARTAMCITYGVPLAHVHPASGHDMGRPYPRCSSPFGSAGASLSGV
jgi:hypothetical protein